MPQDGACEIQVCVLSAPLKYPLRTCRIPHQADIITASNSNMLAYVCETLHSKVVMSSPTWCTHHPSK